jgi:hypothetical protein
MCLSSMLDRPVALNFSIATLQCHNSNPCFGNLGFQVSAGIHLYSVSLNTLSAAGLEFVHRPTQEQLMVSISRGPCLLTSGMQWHLKPSCSFHISLLLGRHKYCISQDGF